MQRLIPYLLYSLGSLCFLAGSFMSIYNETHRWPKRMKLKGKHYEGIIMDDLVTPESIVKEILSTSLDDIRFPDDLEGHRR